MAGDAVGEVCAVSPENVIRIDTITRIVLTIGFDLMFVILIKIKSKLRNKTVKTKINLLFKVFRISNGTTFVRLLLKIDYFSGETIAYQS